MPEQEWAAEQAGRGSTESSVQGCGSCMSCSSREQGRNGMRPIRGHRAEERRAPWRTAAVRGWASPAAAAGREGFGCCWQHS